MLVFEAADAIRAKARKQGLQRARSPDRPERLRLNQLLAAGATSPFRRPKLIDPASPPANPAEGGGCPGLVSPIFPRQPAAGHPARTRLEGGKGRLVHDLAQAGVAVKLMAPPLAELPGWIAGRCAASSSRRRRQARFIAERVEGNLLAAHQEIQKLGLLPCRTLVLEQVRESVLNVARYDLDGLREALLATIGPPDLTLDGLSMKAKRRPGVGWAMGEEIRAPAILRRSDCGQPLEMLPARGEGWGSPREPGEKAPCSG